MNFFIAIDRRCLPNFAPEKLESLTPRIMQWSEDIWILDMGLCLSYWWNRALQEGLDVVTLWRLVLQRLFGGDTLTYSAAVAHHPWLAVLVLGHMRERDLFGLVDYDSPFGRRHFQEVSWRNWWWAAKAVIPHFSLAGRKRLGSFPRSLGQMRRAIKRLRLDRPHTLKTAEPSAIRRRFGSIMGELWGWTYAEEKEGEGRSGLVGFPWRAYQFRAPPVVRRNLDFTLNDWEAMAPLLQEDLNALCRKGIAFDAKEYVLRLLWRLSLADGTTEELELPFRNPHSLHQDAPEQRTAMAQALFRFSSSHGKAAREDRDGILGVIAWEVIVAEKMALPPQVRSLFDDPTGDVQELATLENLLPVPLERLDVRPDWVPESSFGLAVDVRAKVRGGVGEHTVHPDKSVGDRQALVYQSAASDRPLFIFTEPEVLARPGPSGGVRFLERTMEKWWLHCKGADEAPGEPSRSSRRDYYQFLDSEGKSLWVFQNQRKQWFVHGVYG